MRVKKREKEIDVFFLSLSVFQWLELVGTRSKVHIFNEATLQEVGILPILVYFYYSGYCFGLILVPCRVMFITWDGFVVDLRAASRINLG